MRMTLAEFMEAEARIKARSTPKTVHDNDEPKLEKDLHEQILRYCQNQMWLAVTSRMDVATTTARGVPDFLLLLPGGRLLCIECKTKTSKCTVEQLGWKLWAEKLGHRWILIRSMAEFLEATK